MIAAPLVVLVALGGSSNLVASQLRGAGFDETLAQPDRVFEALQQLAVPDGVSGIFVRLVVSATDLRTDESTFERLDGRLRLYSLREIPIVLSLDGFPASLATLPAWQETLRKLALRSQGMVAAYEFGPDAGESALNRSELAYAVRVSAVEIGAHDPEALLILRNGDSLRGGEGATDFGVAGYVDGLSLRADDAAKTSRTDEYLSAAVAGLEGLGPDGLLLVHGVPISESSASRTLEWELARIGERLRLVSYDIGDEDLTAVLALLSPFADLLAGELVELDEGLATLKLEGRAGLDPNDVSHRLLYSLDRFATYLAVWGAFEDVETLRIKVHEASGRRPVIRATSQEEPVEVEDFSWNEHTQEARFSIASPQGPVVLDFNYGSSSVQVSRTDVTEQVLPPVEVVVAHHQRAQALQDRTLKDYMATARMEQHFRPSLTDPGFDVVTDNRFFWDREGVEWQELSFSLNGSKWGNDRPPFPLLQPEKVLSMPLDLRLTDDYLYELDEIEEVRGHDCYVVRFTPVDDSRSLYRGKLWIDTESFVKIKVHAVQAHPGSIVISNEEIQSFAPVATVAGSPLYLFEHLTSRQIMLIAGRNLLVEREIQFSDFTVNDVRFAEERALARQSESIMFRDTDEGLRHLVKKEGRRVVSDRPATSAKALAIGTIVDPSFDYPLPIVGLNYLDFDFLGKDSQLALLFGGVLALVNIQRPQLIGPRVDGSLDFFGIAVSGDDKVFDAEGETEEQRLTTRPLSLGVNLGFQFTAFQKIVGNYQLGYDAYGRASMTASDFTVPNNTLTHGVGLTYEFSKAGYSFKANGSFHKRTSWEPWGNEGDYSSDQDSYTRYSATLSKDFLLGGPHKIHVDASYFGGERLDRFSMYQFGLFEDTRMHGVPSSGVRFPELVMLRGQYSFDVLGIYRIDLFLDSALGNPQDGEGSWESITGTGLGFNLRGPWGTMVRGELGKSFLPSRYSGAGSVVFQITLLKPI